MNAANLLKPTHSIAALRMMAAIIFILHAGVRIYNNSMPGFGNFLESKGFPFGLYLAWTVTAFELAGGTLMFFHRLTKTFCIGETGILIIGIITVNRQNSLSVVGDSLGGAEYSFVLITVLLAVFFAERKAERNITPVL